MPRYANGEIPFSELVKFGEGEDPVTGTWEWWATPATLTRWRRLVTYVEQWWGVTLRITPGWNVYRPLGAQRAYKTYWTARGEPLVAATPGFSPHGGSYGKADSLAVDVENWADIGWERFKEACEACGFAVDQVNPREPWHITDYHPWEMPPAPPTPASRPKEVDMIAVHAKDLLPNWRFLIAPGYIKNAPEDQAMQYALETGQAMNELDNDWLKKALWNHGLGEAFPSGTDEEMKAFLVGLGGGKFYVASWLGDGKVHA